MTPRHAIEWNASRRVYKVVCGGDCGEKNDGTHIYDARTMKEGGSKLEKRVLLLWLMMSNKQDVMPIENLTYKHHTV